MIVLFPQRAEFERVMNNGIPDCRQARFGFFFPSPLSIPAGSEQLLEILFESGDLLLVDRLGLFVFGQGGLGTGQREAGFVAVVVKGEELIVFVLRDVVVLVVMTAGAGQGKSKPSRSRGLKSIHDCSYAPLLLVGSALGVGQSLPVESRGETLFRRGLGQKVTGDLFDGELVVGKILVDRFDHPITIKPGIGPRPVLLVTVRVRITGHVQPVSPPSFSEVRRLQELVDQLGVSAGIPVLCESVDAGWVGWQAQQVIMEAPCEDPAVGLGRRQVTHAFQLGENKVINRT